MQKKKSEIIITVDHGISSFQSIELARKKGMVIIITDHHIPCDTLPHAHAIVNPHLKNCKFHSKNLSGSGVAFYLMLALREALIQSNWFKINQIKIPKLAEFLDLVALGTISDCMPLDLNNRILVYQGLQRIRSKKCRPGIQAIIKTLQIDTSIFSTEDISFYLSPLINVAGRLKNMSIGVSLLLTENKHEAFLIAKKLYFLNKKRKLISHIMEKQAFIICKNEKNFNKKNISGLVLYHQDWHEGMLGIIAARIKEYFYCTTIVFANVKHNLLKGSARSIEEINIRNVLCELDKLYPKLIVSFGGHKTAAGLVIQYCKLSKFKMFFLKLIKSKLVGLSLQKILWSDGQLCPNACSLNTAKLLLSSTPWGNKFPYPTFDGKFHILKQFIVNKRHLKIQITSIFGGPILHGILFNCDLSIWPNKNINSAIVAYKLNIYKHANCCNLQLIIVHLFPF